MEGSVPSRSSPFKPQPDPPSPVSATFVLGTLHVTFTDQLQAGALNAANWLVCDSGFQRNATSALAVGDEVRLTLGPPLLPCPVVGVTFTPPPFDVVSAASGLPAVGFADFPIT